MSLLRKTVLVFVVALLAGFGGRLSLALDWSPPLKKYLGLSATFGEYRPTHLHAGIDLSTGGQNGFRVYSVADGEIFRLRHDKRGYGKALYIRHADGSVAVYAHLSCFENRLGLENIVRRKDSRKGGYAGTIDLKKTIPVKKGAVIGLSGESGSGLPHLHFEMRDKDNNPINPYLSGYFFKDDHPPTLEKLVLEPIDHLSAINGRHDPLIIDFPSQDSPPSILRGKIRIKLQAFDYAASKNRLGLYGIDVIVDGKPALKERFERFSYETAYQVGIVIDPRQSHLSPTVYTYNLFQQTGNRLDTISFAPPFAENCLNVDRLPSGEHRMTIIARDAAGNTTTEDFDFIVNHPPEIVVRDCSPGLVSGEIRLALLVTDRDGTSGEHIRDIQAEYSDDAGISWRPAAMEASLSPLPAPTGAPRWILTRKEPFEGSRMGQLRVRVFDRYECSTWVRSPLIVRLPENHEGDIRFISAGIGKAPEKSAASIKRQRAGGRGRPASVLSIRNRGLFAQVTIRNVSSWSNPSLLLAGPGGRSLTTKSNWLGADTYEVLLPLENLTSGTWKVQLADNPEAAQKDASFEVLPIHPDKGGHIAWDSLELVFPPGSLYQKTFVRRDKIRTTSDPALRAVSQAYRLESSSYPFDKPVTLKLKANDIYEDFKRLGIYSYDSFRKAWRFVGAMPDAREGWVSASVRHFSDYIILEDNAPPVLRKVQPAGDARMKKVSAITFLISDRGMGIDEDSLSVRLDGSALKAEYDPDRRKVTAPVVGSLSKGLHRLSIEAFDHAGNAARPYRASFTIQ